MPAAGAARGPAASAWACPILSPQITGWWWACGSTPATTNSNELAVGYYGDGGSGVLITAGSGWSQRFNNSANSQGTIALEDQALATSGATPNSQWSNASPNSWAVAEVVFKAR